MLAKVKAALRIAAAITIYDAELQDLIDAALLDLGIAGVETIAESNKLIIRAVTTYCKMHFGNPGDYGDYDKLERSYNEQKAQLSTSTEYNGGIYA